MTAAGPIPLLRKHLPVFLVIAVVYALLAAPYVYSSAFQSTAKSLYTSEVSASDLPPVAGLYVNSGTQYYLSIVKPLTSNQTWAVISTRPLPPQSLIYVSSPVASWNVQPYSLSIKGEEGFSMLTVAGSVTFVPQGTANTEFWLLSSGRALLDLSTLVALANPILFIAIAWYFMKRIPLWLLVGVAWVYVVQFLATDFIGSAYGLYPSFALLAAAVVLVPGAFVADKLEASIRERLAKSPGPASS